MTVRHLAESIVEAAAADGVHLTLDPSAVSRWIAGENEPHMKYRRYIAQVLEKDPHDLFEPVQEWAKAG
jgi:hypothetical protein